MSYGLPSRFAKGHSLRERISLWWWAFKFRVKGVA